ncbi:MAG: HAMP domain-containing histidine kinase [Defluviitaleaceae bacterium]|nr:HAMP domain-containing histidine kinase [Defluviitaleaceae bacterium]
MRFFAKSFLCTTFVLSVALLVSGYLLITFSHESAIAREVERALNQFQYDNFMVQSHLISHGGGSFERLSSEVSGMTAFFTVDLQLIYSDIPQLHHFSLFDEIYGNTRIVSFKEVEDATYIVVGGIVRQGDMEFYLLIANDITAVIAQRQQMTRSFAQIYFFTLLFSMVIVLILCGFITIPIRKMNRAASEISKGRYNERLHVSSHDEIGELSRSFNKMVDAVEEKINELMENARQKDDFVANFAHELKTPLTSVIGYADMIYQKDLPPERIKSAAWYILNEGMRLESLSLKLMDLIVLNRQDFVLEEMNAEALLQDIAGSLAPKLEEKKVAMHLNIQPAYIKVDYDLFKTLILNLIDNAINADSKTIDISGKHDEKGYSMCVSDDGRGIPDEELTRITEAFYTVDKSRSRKQHGAGIGLSLAAKIAEVHQSTLSFSSKEGVGTMITFVLEWGACRDM